MRTAPADGCGGFTTTVQNTTGVIHYQGADDALPTSSPNTLAQDCIDVDPDKLNPVLTWMIDRHAVNNVTADTFDVELQGAPDLSVGPPFYAHWLLRAQPMWLDFERPTILNLAESLANPNYTIVAEPYHTGFLYLVLDASNITVTHPIHLHGSDFVVLAQSTEKWDEATSPRLFNYDNPPRRDTAMLPVSQDGGFLVIAFKPDNPGAWLLHCHIAWHASSGQSSALPRVS